MTARFQRLLIIILSLILLTLGILLILFNSKKNLIFFYTPTELLNSNVKINDIVRIGGVVKKNTIIIEGNNNYKFIITDYINNLNINYNGLLPDLFKEEQGAVIQGVLINTNVIKADSVFAKHDENYMPQSIKKQLETNDYWGRKYE